MVAPLAAVGTAKAASKVPQNKATGLILALGVAWFVLQVVPKIPFKKLNIVPETKEFTSSFLNQNRYGYAEDQTGSPNPPSAVWWMDEWIAEDPLPVGSVSQESAGWRSTPTPPIMDVDEITEASKLGQDANRWFTNKWLYPWFSGAEKILEDASDQTNADRFRDYNTGVYQ